MFAIHIYAAGEYPIRIKTSGVKDFWIGKSLTGARIDDLYIDFIDNEIIAITDNDNTVWLNPNWRNSPYTINELLPLYPAHPRGLSSEAG